MESTLLPRGYCLACGYALQGLTEGAAGYVCPECGRAFDPANSKTYSAARYGRLVRWLATPVGWLWVCLSLAAAGGVMSVSRWKWGSFEPSTIDLEYYLNPSALRHRTSIETVSDGVYTASMLVAIVAFSS